MPCPLPSIGTTIRLKANAHRYRRGPARVLRHERRGNVRPRMGMVVAFEGREIWIMPGEAEDRPESAH
jgi:hypothetical protein